MLLIFIDSRVADWRPQARPHATGGAFNFEAPARLCAGARCAGDGPSPRSVTAACGRMRARPTRRRAERWQARREDQTARSHTHVEQRQPPQRFDPQRHRRRDRPRQGSLLRRRGLGRALPGGRHRHLAFGPRGVDLALRGRAARGQREANRSAADAVAGREQPVHRHAPADLAPPRARNAELLRLPGLLGRCRPVGHERLAAAAVLAAGHGGIGGRSSAPRRVGGG